MKRILRPRTGALVSLIVAWAVYALAVTVGNSVQLSPYAEMNTYWWKFLILSFFFIGVLISVIAMHADSGVRVGKKIGYDVSITVHYFGLISLMLLGGGAQIPIAQVGAFFLGGLVTVVLGTVIFFDV